MLLLRSHPLLNEETIWQTLTKEELDNTVRLMIALHLIRRRRNYYQVVKWQGYIFSKVVEMKPFWEYQVTSFGERILAILEWFTRRGILKA